MLKPNSLLALIYSFLSCVKVSQYSISQTSCAHHSASFASATLIHARCRFPLTSFHVLLGLHELLAGPGECIVVFSNHFELTCKATNSLLDFLTFASEFCGVISIYFFAAPTIAISWWTATARIVLGLQYWWWYFLIRLDWFVRSYQYYLMLFLVNLKNIQIYESRLFILLVNLRIDVRLVSGNLNCSNFFGWSC